MTTLDSKLRTRSLSILIIEDNPDTAESLARFLTLGCDCTVIMAHDGIAGINMARTFCPDVVICDLGLPKRNGILVAEELLATLPCRPLLIAITGFGAQITCDLAQDAGFDHYLIKPADPFVVEDLIEAHATRMGIPY